MSEFIAKLCRLIDVKSIVTLMLSAVFVIMSCKEIITAEQFIAIYTVIIGFYFGTQFQKGVQERESK